MNVHRAGPQLLRADASEVDRSLAVHARGLRGAGVKAITGHYPHTVEFPAADTFVGRRSGRIAGVFAQGLLLLKHHILRPRVAPAASPDWETAADMVYIPHTVTRKTVVV